MMSFPIRATYHESSGYQHDTITDGRVYTVLAYTPGSDRRSSTFLIVADDGSFVELPIRFFTMATKLEECLK